MTENFWLRGIRVVSCMLGDFNRRFGGQSGFLEFHCISGETAIEYDSWLPYSTVYCGRIVLYLGAVS